jgi:hypothetical protein
MQRHAFHLIQCPFDGQTLCPLDTAGFTVPTFAASHCGNIRLSRCSSGCAMALTLFGFSNTVRKIHRDYHSSHNLSSSATARNEASSRSSRGQLAINPETTISILCNPAKPPRGSAFATHLRNETRRKTNSDNRFRARCQPDFCGPISGRHRKEWARQHDCVPYQCEHGQHEQFCVLVSRLQKYIQRRVSSHTPDPSRLVRSADEQFKRTRLRKHYSSVERIHRRP